LRSPLGHRVEFLAIDGLTEVESDLYLIGHDAGLRSEHAATLSNGRIYLLLYS
jgi:hypothetical protein